MSENNSKKLAELSDHELLIELVEINRRKQVLIMALSMLALIVSAAVLISAYILIPRMLQSMEEISQVTIEGAEKLQELDKIDFDTLNKGISDFAKVVNTLSKWFGG